jgi:hypothetical protein
LLKSSAPKAKGALPFSAHVKLGLVAAAFFILAYAVETKAILALESSQDLFEVIR